MIVARGRERQQLQEDFYRPNKTTIALSLKWL